MKRLQADVVVIGGGSTGLGVVRDAAMRGYKAVLVERDDLAVGTTGRFHGLLHSGGRYVVSDPQSARECSLENEVLRRIQPGAIEDTGGFFVSLPGDDPAFVDQFLAGAKETGVPAREISVGEALRREPRLNPGIQRAVEVRDGSIDGWQLVWGAARSAREHGGEVLTYHRVTRIERSGSRVAAVICRDTKHHDNVTIDCNFVLNCGGPWAGQITMMAGCDPVQVVPGRGIMLAMNHRLVNTVVNRCVYPTDGDILVPAHTVSIIGTTDTRAQDPDDCTIPADEVQQMLDAGEHMIPGFRRARVLRAWAGNRPLIKDPRVSASDTRHMSRGMAIIDHSEHDGLDGMLTIGGGKLTTYRLMAEHIVDAMCEKLGDNRPCRTAQEPVPEAHPRIHRVTDRLKEREARRTVERTLCECELVSESAFVRELAEQPDANLDDVRRQLRVGMGPCQGGFCATRAAGVACSSGHADPEHSTALLRNFLSARWKGIRPILFGEQVRQTVLDDWIFTGTLDVNHLPASEDPKEEAR
ncbi:anaerobic glycerol-3-phosphate dehydrogenase subunit GlpA [Tessaracoccus sp. OH4464_COT-324]|uniref:anaerobic glycerol-3-phosphate dehydrogenase subunit GlpA n=1 Tax=Tessaracoccus sp. OH4464_COT-324 TaxID=2491059 RepID=UPI000F62F409|nr:anaerobic glycerol-3-phosphate dehydrogenase subunit GlpA [Tessaracoccus sp. OH4464_COT-324]RRD46266.1 anaerobic glycerol-3-phosphate dehydrogenase subunit A [Tessaracoccus sp. OH4464_COT-324]